MALRKENVSQGFYVLAELTFQVKRTQVYQWAGTQKILFPRALPEELSRGRSLDDWMTVHGHEDWWWALNL